MPFGMRKVQDTEITVTHDRSYQAAMRLRSENPEAKIAVLNFANAFTPGGGVTIVPMHRRSVFADVLLFIQY